MPRPKIVHNLHSLHSLFLFSAQRTVEVFIAVGRTYTTLALVTSWRRALGFNFLTSPLFRSVRLCLFDYPH
jgi:hypothetical protein